MGLKSFALVMARQLVPILHGAEPADIPVERPTKFELVITTPLTTLARCALQAWLKEPLRKGATALFPNVHGARLSADSVQSLLGKHVRVAHKSCPSLKAKSVSPHVLRHSAAMELLQAGVDCSVIALWLALAAGTGLVIDVDDDLNSWQMLRQ
jgi:integrase